jgi:hypothetical protein
VKSLQLLLRHYVPLLAVDGRFGPRTERAVRAAQRRLGVFPVDGLAGPCTLAALTRAAVPARSAASPDRGPDRREAGRPGPGGGGPESFGGKFEDMAGRARSSLLSTGSEALSSIQHAIQDMAGWIAGLSTKPAAVPSTLRHVVPPARAKAQQAPMPPGEVTDPRQLRLSIAGQHFIFRHEAGNGRLTAHLHHPPGHSGVTLGPGYDMRARSGAEVAATLTGIGVNPAAAAAASKGAGLHDEAADRFARDNRSLLDLSMEQQVTLQNNYKRTYEQMVYRAAHIPLHQYEFDALVSFAGNPGTSTIWHTTMRLVNEHRPQDAMAEIFKATHTGNAKMHQGLVNRRTAESRLFLYGDYAA